MAFPAVLLAIGIAAALGPFGDHVVIALAAVYIPRTARIVRASVLVVREARVRSGGDRDRAPSDTCASSYKPRPAQLHGAADRAAHLHLRLCGAGGGRAELPWLGAPPPTPTWGNIIAEGRNFIREATLDHADPGRSPSRSPCWASTCSATGCATCSTRVSRSTPVDRRPARGR
jgi:peptide/nickel transport system permease protein